MTCQNTCETSSLFASTREARLSAIAQAKREEEARKEQIARLQEVRTAIAVRDAKEQARYQAIVEAEKEFKIRERDILEKQLAETLELSKRMQEQYQEFVVTTSAISEKLQNPAMLFKTATIKSVDEFKDYFKLTYEDGRTVNVPMGAIDFILKSKLDAVETLFDCLDKDIKEVAKANVENSEQTTHLAELFKQLVSNIAQNETDSEIRFEEFKSQVQKQVQEMNANVAVLASSFEQLNEMVGKLQQVVSAVIETE